MSCLRSAPRIAYSDCPSTVKGNPTPTSHTSFVSLGYPMHTSAPLQPSFKNSRARPFSKNSVKPAVSMSSFPATSLAQHPVRLPAAAKRINNAHALVFEEYALCAADHAVNLVWNEQLQLLTTSCESSYSYVFVGEHWKSQRVTSHGSTSLAVVSADFTDKGKGLFVYHEPYAAGLVYQPWTRKANSSEQEFVLEQRQFCALPPCMIEGHQIEPRAPTQAFVCAEGNRVAAAFNAAIPLAALFEINSQSLQLSQHSVLSFRATDIGHDLVTSVRLILDDSQQQPLVSVSVGEEHSTLYLGWATGSHTVLTKLALGLEATHAQGCALKIIKLTLQLACVSATGRACYTQCSTDFDPQRPVAIDPEAWIPVAYTCSCTSQGQGKSCPLLGVTFASGGDHAHLIGLTSCSIIVWRRHNECDSKWQQIKTTGISLLPHSTPPAAKPNPRHTWEQLCETTRLVLSGQRLFISCLGVVLEHTVDLTVA